MKSRIIIAIILTVGSISVGVAYAWTSLGTDDMYILSGKKLGLSGSGSSNYISEPAGNGRIDFISNGVTALQLKNNYIAPNVDFLMSAGQKFALDGTGTYTYMKAGANTTLFYTKGIQALVIGSDQSLQVNGNIQPLNNIIIPNSGQSIVAHNGLCIGYC